MTLQDILNSLGASSEGNSQGSAIQLPKPKFFVGLTFIILLAIAGFTSFFMVDETEQAVVLQLGKYNRTMGPGLHFKLPLFIERNFNVATRIVQNQTFGFRTAKAGIVSSRARGDYSQESTMLTGDLNIANVEWSIQYRISDPKNWLFNVEDTVKTIRDISISVINQLVGDYYITDVLGDARTEIESTSLVMMNDFFKEYQLGINITAVKLQNIVPPEGRVQEAFEDVNKAVQDMNRLINEGREEYNKQIPKSRGEAKQMLQLAEGYATERVNEAEGDVARFKSVLTEYRRNPRVTRDRIYYETIENIIGKDADGDTRFIDDKFNNLVPVLPLGNSNSFNPAQ